MVGVIQSSEMLCVPIVSLLQLTAYQAKHLLWPRQLQRADGMCFHWEHALLPRPLQSHCQNNKGQGCDFLFIYPAHGLLHGCCGPCHVLVRIIDSEY